MSKQRVHVRATGTDEDVDVILPPVDLGDPGSVDRALLDLDAHLIAAGATEEQRRVGRERVLAGIQSALQTRAMAETFTYTCPACDEKAVPWSHVVACAGKA